MLKLLCKSTMGALTIKEINKGSLILNVIHPIVSGCIFSNVLLIIPTTW